jgi:hypothetical protein
MQNITVHPATGHEGTEGKYSSTLSLTSVLGAGEPFYPRVRNQGPIVQEARWAQGQVWTGAVNPPPPAGFDPRIIHLFAIHTHNIKGQTSGRWDRVVWLAITEVSNRDIQPRPSDNPRKWLGMLPQNIHKHVPDCTVS